MLYYIHDTYIERYVQEILTNKNAKLNNAYSKTHEKCIQNYIYIFGKTGFKDRGVYQSTKKE